MLLTTGISQSNSAMAVSCANEVVPSMSKIFNGVMLGLAMFTVALISEGAAFSGP
jgi:hypothetical protein